MTNFETEVYNREDGNVIGARVIVSANDGQTIDSIQVTNKTQFDELKSKLDTLNEDYVQFEDGSDLKGSSLDTILQNSNEQVNINATNLNGFQSDSFAKTNHAHKKANISDLYNYDISLGSYNLEPNGSCIVTVTVTNASNTPVKNHEVIIYKNNQSWRTGKTNQNGIYSTTFLAESSGRGIVTFAVNNQKVQCNIRDDTGWIDLPLNTAIVKEYSEGRRPKYRVIGKVVEIRGAVTPKKKITFDESKGNNVVAYIPQQYAPAHYINRVQQGSNAFHFLESINNAGAISIDKYTNNTTVRQETPVNSWLNINMVYLIG